jgi:hypothetical protein
MTRSKSTLGRIGRQAAGIDVQLLAGGELALDQGAAHLDEHPAVAFQALHDEAFAAEQAGHHPLLEVDADRHAARGGQEAVLLADQRAAQLAQVQRQDRARRRRGEGHARLARPVWVKTVVNRLSPVTRRLPAPSSLPMKPPPPSAEPSPNTVVIWTAGVLPDERAGLGHGALARIQLDLDELQLLALDLEVDVVGDAQGTLIKSIRLTGDRPGDRLPLRRHQRAGAARRVRQETLT